MQLLTFSGPIVRLGPNTLSINTIGALEEIYASRKANVQKAEWYRTLDAGSGAFSTHSEIDRSKHAFRRRVLAHAFSDAAVRSAETLILENIDIWCKYLGEGEPVKNMGDWAKYLSYDIMGHLTFGTRFECIEKNEHRYVPGLMMRATEYVYVVRRPHTLLKTIITSHSSASSPSSASFDLS
jgi:cytochrome P450